MIKATKADIEKYSKTVGSEEIGGSLDKLFVRLNSKFLSGFLKEASKPECYYVTHVDDLIDDFCKGKDASYFPLSKVSVMLKQERYKYIPDKIETLNNEVLGSRVCNAVGVPTVYNDIIKIDKDYYTMSIDFVKPSQKIIRLIGNGRVNDTSHFPEWEKLFDEQLPYVLPAKSNKEKIIKQLKSSFVEPFLVHNLILDDADFYPRNTCLIENTKRNTFSWAPQNDFELILGGRNKNDFDKDAEVYLTYLFYHYPVELKKFMKKVMIKMCKNEQLNEAKVESFFDDEMKKNDWCVEQIQQLKDNFNRLINTYKKVVDREKSRIEHVNSLRR